MAMEDKEFQAYKKRAFDFIWEELDPIALEIEKTGHIPRKELWPKFRDMGFLAMNVPKEYGGMGLSEVQYLEFEKEWVIKLVPHLQQELMHQVEKKQLSSLLANDQCPLIME